MRWLTEQSSYLIPTTSNDTIFFFNFNDSNVAVFGSSLFFLQILENKYTLKYHKEFESPDQLYTCMVNTQSLNPHFDSFLYEENILHPNFQILNEIKNIRQVRDNVLLEKLDRVSFRASYRWVLV